MFTMLGPGIALQVEFQSVIFESIMTEMKGQKTKIGKIVKNS